MNDDRANDTAFTPSRFIIRALDGSRHIDYGLAFAVGAWPVLLALDAPNWLASCLGSGADAPSWASMLEVNPRIGVAENLLLVVSAGIAQFGIVFLGLLSRPKNRSRARRGRCGDRADRREVADDRGRALAADGSGARHTLSAPIPRPQAVAWRHRERRSRKEAHVHGCRERKGAASMSSDLSFMWPARAVI